MTPVKNEIRGNVDEVYMQGCAASDKIFNGGHICPPAGIALSFAIIDLRHGCRVDDDVRPGMAQHLLHILWVGNIHSIRFSPSDVMRRVDSCSRYDKITSALLQNLGKLLTEKYIRTCYYSPLYSRSLSTCSSILFR